MLTEAERAATLPIIAKCTRCGRGFDSKKADAEKALYLYQRLGLTEKNQRLVAARVELFEIEPAPHGANEYALNNLNAIGLRPSHNTDKDG